MWKESAPKQLNENFFRTIDDDWMLITAGRLPAASGQLSSHAARSYNTMTASWGGVGILWGLEVAFWFVRPQRHTFRFTESTDRVTLSFFPERLPDGRPAREVLSCCGSRSGRDTDKAAACRITPFAPEDDVVSFEEARLVLICRKLYAGSFDPDNFVDHSLREKIYEAHDYHRAYIGRIERVLVRAEQ